MTEKVRKGVTIINRETLFGLNQAQRDDLTERIRKIHTPGTASMLISLMEKYNYRDSLRVLDLAERQVRGLRTETPSRINIDDVNDIVRIWYDRIRTDKNFPRSISQFTKQNAENFTGRIAFRGPAVKYA